MPTCRVVSKNIFASAGHLQHLVALLALSTASHLQSPVDDWKRNPGSARHSYSLMTPRGQLDHAGAIDSRTRVLYEECVSDYGTIRTESVRHPIQFTSPRAFFFGAT